MSSARSDSNLPFPYEIYTRQGADTALALMWRLKDNARILPANRIWLIGTQQDTRGLNRLSKQERCAQELGLQLAKNNIGLMTGGNYHDDPLLKAAIEGYADTFVQDGRSLSNFLTHYTTRDNKDTEMHTVSAVLTFDDRDAVFSDMISNCTACILIGGEEGSLKIAQNCLDANRLVFPIAETGGAARQLYDLLDKDIERQMPYGQSFHLLAMNDKHEIVIPRILDFIESEERYFNTQQ